MVQGIIGIPYNKQQWTKKTKVPFQHALFTLSFLINPF